MQISPEERPGQPEPTSSTGKWIMLVIGLALLGGIGYFVTKPPETPPATEQIPEEIVQETETSAPPAPPQEPVQAEIKESIPEQPKQPEEPTFVLPTLDESDEQARLKLNELTTTTNLANWFHNEFLIRRGVTFVDGLSRGIQLNKMHKVPMPKTRFMAVKEGEKYWLNPNNYSRYNYFIKVIAAIDINTLTNSFHLFRPLLEEAYGELGYSPKDLDSAIVSALDQLISTPTVDGPIELTHESVTYQYADPQLESLPPIQKQLLRMGPDHTRVIQKKAEQLRAALLKPH